MTGIDWAYCQNNSDKILSDGLLKLKNCETCCPLNISFSEFGNYLISKRDIHYYIGECKNMRNRIKQQFNVKTSNFYKNYIKYTHDNKNRPLLSIDSFCVRFISTNIGRKEIEEFGIVNLPTYLNRFQLGKRNKINLKIHDGLWDKVQIQKNELLQQAEEEIFNHFFKDWFECNLEAEAGIYIVKDKTNLIYIGESSDIFKRHVSHSNTTYFSALRRHVASDLLGYELKERNGKKKYLSDSEEKNVTDYLRGTTAAFFPVSFGRYELEEYLIKKYQPLLNRKSI